jgi:hypothetical protein
LLGAHLIDLKPGLQQRGRRPGQAQPLELEPDALGVRDRQTRQAQVERDQPVQAGHLDHGSGTGERAFELRGEQPFAGTGLRETECGDDHKENQAQRDT